MELKNMKLAIISGGSKGLGKELCEQYLAQDFEVIEFSRTAPHSYSIAIDLALANSVGQIVSEALITLATREWQEIVVINNAGMLTPMGPASKKGVESIVANLNTNFVSGILFMIEVLRHFQSHTGKKTLVSISSGAALGERAGWSLYCGAKAGLEHFIRSVAKEQDAELQPFKVINVDPGLIDTDMQLLIRQSNIEDFPSLEQFKHRKGMGLLASPTKVAEGVVHIIDVSSVNNGERIKVSPDLP
ncbi:MAG: benzil reductase ((S)-benzoin forming) [Gammaproteobacteria bacterium]|jgi:benzil reductase ((S)-benzoin forming)